MQNINTSYTVYLNRKYQRSGHLFQGRVKGIIVDKDRYLIGLSRYIHLNPVRAEVVQRPGDYRWTSYRTFMDKKAQNSLVDTADTLSYFSKKRRKAIAAYRDFVEGGEGRDEKPFEEVEAGLVLGGKRFKAKIMKLIDKIKEDEEIPQARRLQHRVSIDAIIDACASFYGKSRGELVRRGRGRKQRQVAIYLSKVLSDQRGKEVGGYFGIKGPAVSGVIKGIEGRLEKETKLRKEIESIRQEVINEF